LRPARILPRSRGRGTRRSLVEGAAGGSGGPRDRRPALALRQAQGEVLTEGAAEGSLPKTIVVNLRSFRGEALPQPPSW
jgi:hypothetical protein